MRIVDSDKEHLVDLKWPRLLPTNMERPASTPVPPVPAATPSHGQTFQLTGWRGAGWRLVFLEEPPR
jgi:hypothetical protein